MPNWKDPKAYNKKRNRAGWAWEFMRRNPDYRADFAEVAKEWKSLPRKGHLYVSGKAYEVEQLDRRRAVKWGQLGPIADPCDDAAPLFFANGPIEPDGEQVNGFFYEPEKSELIIQRSEFSTLTFDLRRPLRPQLQRAASLLRERKKSVPPIKPARSSEEQWPLYLRVLDAKEAGAKTGEIVATIEDYRDAGKKTDTPYAGADRVSDHLKRARQLRDAPLSLIL